MRVRREVGTDGVDQPPVKVARAVIGGGHPDDQVARRRHRGQFRDCRLAVQPDAVDQFQLRPASVRAPYATGGVVADRQHIDRRDHLAAQGVDKAGLARIDLTTDQNRKGDNAATCGAICSGSTAISSSRSACNRPL